MGQSDSGERIEILGDSNLIFTVDIQRGVSPLFSFICNPDTVA